MYIHEQDQSRHRRDRAARQPYRRAVACRRRNACACWFGPAAIWRSCEPASRSSKAICATRKRSKRAVKGATHRLSLCGQGQRLGTVARCSRKKRSRRRATSSRLARRANVPRLLHVSSISVYGHPKLSASAKIVEDTPLGQGFWMWDYYPRAKLLAEQIAREFPATTIVRPSWLYGPRDRVTMPARHSGPPGEAGADHRLAATIILNIIYAGDVAAGDDPRGQSSASYRASVQPVQRRGSEAERPAQHVDRCAVVAAHHETCAVLGWRSGLRSCRNARTDDVQQPSRRRSRAARFI